MKTVLEFCQGKMIQKIELESRGAWEGCTGRIVFTDGSILNFTEEATGYDKDGNEVELAMED